MINTSTTKEVPLNFESWLLTYCKLTLDEYSKCEKTEKRAMKQEYEASLEELSLNEKET